jgi:hypothetical protein
MTPYGCCGRFAFADLELPEGVVDRACATTPGYALIVGLLKIVCQIIQRLRRHGKGYSTGAGGAVQVIRRGAH